MALRKNETQLFFTQISVEEFWADIVKHKQLLPNRLGLLSVLVFVGHGLLTKIWPKSLNPHWVLLH